jgi:hypothetical protein
MGLVFVKPQGKHKQSYSEAKLEDPALESEPDSVLDAMKLLKRG